MTGEQKTDKDGSVNNTNTGKPDDEKGLRQPTHVKMPAVSKSEQANSPINTNDAIENAVVVTWGFETKRSYCMFRRRRHYKMYVVQAVQVKIQWSVLP